MPKADRLRPGPAYRPDGVDVVESAGKRDDPNACGHDGSLLTVQSSITVLANSASAISATVASSTESSTSNSNRLPCRTSETPAWPSRFNAPTIAWPCGSRISAFGMTLTTTRATQLLLAAGVLPDQ